MKSFRELKVWEKAHCLALDIYKGFITEAPMPYTDRPKASSPNGFALVELLTVLVLTGFFSSVLLQTTLCIQRCLAHWETSARMRQTLSAALFLMSRDFVIICFRSSSSIVWQYNIIN